MHIPSLVKIHCYLLKLSSGNEKTDDGWMDRHTDVQHETKIPRHYCVAGYNKKKIINLSSAENAQRTVKVKALCKTAVEDILFVILFFRENKTFQYENS